jgi:hypothetical protein
MLAVDLAAIERQHDLVGAVIAHDPFSIPAKIFDTPQRRLHGRTRDREHRTDHDRPFRFVVQSWFDTLVDENDRAAPPNAAGEPQGLGVVLGSRSAEIYRIDHRDRSIDDGQAIGLGPMDEVVQGREAAGAGHVLHDDVGLSGQILAQIGRDHPAGCVGAAAGLRADHHGDGLALEGRGVLRRCTGKTNDDHRNGDDPTPGKPFFPTEHCLHSLKTGLAHRQGHLACIGIRGG